MIIDFHTHVGDHRTPERMERLPVTWKGLIERLDEEGIDKAVVLPSGVSPESMKAPFLFSPQVDIIGQLKAARKYQDRIIAFGNLDPRMGCLGNLEPHQVGSPPQADFTWILERFRELSSITKGLEPLVAPLSSIEEEVLRLIANGNSAETVAYEFNASQKVVVNHITSIMHKLDVNQRTHQAVASLLVNQS